MAHEFLPERDKKCARALRRAMTDAERKLWYALRAHRFENIGFRRQVPIGPYVADFASHAARLIVEVDGGQHGSSVDKDTARSEWLATRGYRVLRFWNNDVLRNLEGVLVEIAATIHSPTEAAPAHPAATAQRHMQ